MYAAVGILIVVYGLAANTLTYGILRHAQSGCGLRYRKTFECQVLYIVPHGFLLFVKCLTLQIRCLDAQRSTHILKEIILPVREDWYRLAVNPQ